MRREDSSSQKSRWLKKIVCSTRPTGCCPLLTLLPVACCSFFFLPTYIINCETKKHLSHLGLPFRTVFRLSMAIHVSLLVVLGGLLIAVFIWFQKRRTSTSPLPPGPKPLPILGNIKNLTSKELWLPAHQWAKQFGSNLPYPS